eukprot:CAMPEP_0117034960 /NCGR_PEP_ID=MMETSP0472-20121206/24860_1 /TAXON_ID=693140 ORGANISM="Tiarina fusus, Strain LIS" /NCGR_SAMPLE_ID=MMETSP0472 /ASSEMBLY_ACC=CAM_ASM_000603 /LENGTH=259 /DNA_ID=CAMNT_0004744291 /DNA_START=63 /DNA_END=842 /DNA_ORIENTATION=-
METCKRANAVGVQNLLLGNHIEAAIAFTEALKVTKLVLDDHKDERGPCAVLGSSSLESSSSRPIVVAVPQEKERESNRMDTPSCSHFLSLEQLRLSADVEEREERCRRFVYTTPLQITETAQFSSREATVGVSVAIMFNLALSHHLRALHQYDEESTLQTRHFVLQQAIALYEVAYTILMQEGVDVLSVESTLAIINNLGQIHQAMRNQEKASRCFRHLLSTIVFVQSYGGGQEEVESTEVFVQSVSHLILRELVAPAA